ncbi:MAG: DUF7620 family protein [Mycobacterium sp.]
MQLPWNRHRDEIAQARAAVADREREVGEAEERRNAARQLAAVSASSSAALRRELALNGFTALIEKAMRHR